MTDDRRFSIEEIAAYFAVPAELAAEPDPFIEMRKWVEAEERRLVERFLGIGDGYLDRARK